jgi:hypothetical protein
MKYLNTACHGLFRNATVFCIQFPSILSVWGLLGNIQSTLAMSADNTAVMAVGEAVENSTRKLQSDVNKVTIWTQRMVNITQRIQIGTY